jgi:hypothetical protein
MTMVRPRERRVKCRYRAYAMADAPNQALQLGPDVSSREPRPANVMENIVYLGGLRESA